VLLEARRALREGRVTAALDALAPLVERHDELGARALGFLAMAELAQQKPEQAAVAARRALALVPEDAVATYALALALGTLGSPDARAWVRRARRATPSDPLLAELDRALAPH